MEWTNVSTLILHWFHLGSILGAPWFTLVPPDQLIPQLTEVEFKQAKRVNIKTCRNKLAFEIHTTSFALFNNQVSSFFSTFDFFFPTISMSERWQKTTFGDMGWETGHCGRWRWKQGAAPKALKSGDI